MLLKELKFTGSKCLTQAVQTQFLTECEAEYSPQYLEATILFFPGMVLLAWCCRPVIKLREGSCRAIEFRASLDDICYVFVR